MIRSVSLMGLTCTQILQHTTVYMMIRSVSLMGLTCTQNLAAHHRLHDDLQSWLDGCDMYTGAIACGAFCFRHQMLYSHLTAGLLLLWGIFVLEHWVEPGQ